MLLPDAVAAALAALQAGDWKRGADLLEPVATDDELRDRPDLADIRARVLSLLAQACLGSGQLDAASRWVAEAEVIARRLDDADGLTQILALREEVDAARDRAIRQAAADDRLRRIAKLPAETVVAMADDPGSGWLEYATAALTVGRLERARDAAHHALAHAAGSASPVRTRVMAYLALARAEPEEAEGHLTAGWREADRHDEFALVTAVARAAEEAGLRIAEHRLPSATARDTPDGADHDTTS